ncbi:aspartyl protease family protein [Carboxylicivirga taeanensis]|uniref:retropepsin-like aspartic protease n=1 Tax=Carboxylicivirga taeanensis TaxID=1416875 RepID=UPI003F6DD9FE
MVKNVTLILIVFCSSVAFGQKITTYSPKEYYKKVALNPNYRSLVVSGVIINGSSKQYNFILDTGSSYSVISEQIKQDLNLKSTGVDSVSDGIDTNLFPFVETDISISGVEFSHVKCMVMDLTFVQSRECGIDGILGINLIKNGIWKLSKDSIEIASDFKHISKKGYHKPKLSFATVPYIQVELERNFQFYPLFDTGDNTFLAISSSVVPMMRKLQLKRGWGHYYSTAFGNSIVDTVAVFMPETNFLIGETSLTGIVSDINYEDDHSLGVDFLDYYSVILDLTHKRLFIKQIVQEFSIRKTFGFDMTYSCGELAISFVWEGTPAFYAGLDVGQKILRINGNDLKDLEDLDACVVNSRLKSCLEQEVISVKINGIDEVINLKKEPIFD